MTSLNTPSIGTLEYELRPCWWSKRAGNDLVAKALDRLLQAAYEGMDADGKVRGVLVESVQASPSGLRVRARFTAGHQTRVLEHLANIVTSIEALKPKDE